MRAKVLGLTFLALVAVVLLAACGSTDTIGTTYFRRMNSYTVASEVPNLMGSVSDDMSVDQIVAVINRWAEAKYDTKTVQETGYEQKARLTIAYGHVGVLQVGPYRLILPPRAYANLPQGDDEVRDVAALCVGPGYIAWRYDFQSRLETRVAQSECYLMPVEGWQIVPSLRVEPGKVAYQMQEDGAYKFLSPNPGVYPAEIAAQWVVTDATSIAPNTFGIYIQPNNGVAVALMSRIHYDVIPSMVRIYKSTEMRYRTLDVKVYNENKAPGSPACSSELCGTIIDTIVISGTQRLASFNVDVGFRALNPDTPDVLNKYVNLGLMDTAVVNFIEGPVREAVRSVGVDMNQQLLESEAGKIEFERRVLAKVQEGTLDKKNIPFRMTYVNLRNRNFDDADLRTAAKTSEVQLQAERDRIAAADARLKAIQSETAALQALQAQITIKMASISQVVNIQDGISCTELVLLDNLGLVDVDWATLPKEMCLVGGTSVSITTAPTP